MYTLIHKTHEVIINGKILILIFNVYVMHITYNNSDNTTHTNWDVFPSIYSTLWNCKSLHNISVF